VGLARCQVPATWYYFRGWTDHAREAHEVRSLHRIDAAVMRVKVVTRWSLHRTCNVKSVEKVPAACCTIAAS
jgi:hypothetical protein